MRRPRTVASLTLLAVACVATLVLTPAPGWAADTLRASDPSDREVLAAAPAAVTLTFSATPDPDQSHVSAWFGSVELDSGELAREGATSLREPVSVRGKGNYTVAYHVVFEDGSDLVGVLSFSVGTGVPPPAAADDPAQQAALAAEDEHSHGVDPLSGTLLVADVVVLCGVVFLLWRRPAPRWPAGDDSGSPESTPAAPPVP